jgi:hypothetical protein
MHAPFRPGPVFRHGNKLAERQQAIRSFHEMASSGRLVVRTGITGVF